MPETQKYWFAARTRNKQKFTICKPLPRLKSEGHLNVDCYLLTRITVFQLGYRRKRSEAPAIRNLVFIRTAKQTACSLSNVCGMRLFYVGNLFTRSMFVVPDKQMSDFMFAVDLNPDGISFDNGSLVIGDRIRTVKGDLADIEDGVAANASRTCVITRIKGILTASIKVPKSYLKITE